MYNLTKHLALYPVIKRQPPRVVPGIGRIYRAHFVSWH